MNWNWKHISLWHDDECDLPEETCQDISSPRKFLSANSMSPATANHSGANTFKDVFVSRSVALELNLNFNKSRAQQPIELNGEQEHAENEVWQRC